LGVALVQSMTCFSLCIVDQQFNFNNIEKVHHPTKDVIVDVEEDDDAIVIIVLLLRMM
jgi:hypothetical protein